MFVYAIASALLLYLSFPNLINLYGFWPLGWLFAIPLFIALERKNILERLKIGSVFGLIAYAFILSWLIPLNVLGYFSLVLAFGLHPIIFCLLYRIIPPPISLRSNILWGHVIDVLFVPALWVTAEFLRAIYLGGFSWTLGYSQCFFPTGIQVAQLAGSYGISFALVLFNYCLYRILRDYTRKYFYGALAAGVVSFICAFGYISLVDNHDQEASIKAFQICSIQPNISTKTKWNDLMLDEVVDEHIDLTLECLDESQPDLVVWPETAIPDDFIKDRSMRSKVTQIARKVKTNLLLGAALYENDRYYNSAVLLDGRGDVRDIYRKKHLIPFSEYLPWSHYLAFMRGLFDLNVVDFYRGQTPGIMSLGKTGRQNAALQKFGVAICSEDGYPGLFRKLIDGQAGFVVVMLNDAWFKQKAAMAMHLQMSIMRAVENRISVVRAANSGWSCSITPSGQIHSSLKDKSGNILNTRGVGKFFVFPGTTGTFYNQYGDFFAVFCLGFVIMTFMVRFLQLRKNKSSV